ncbi:MAG: tetratricopeptide repeat protein [Akkermansiaceae bacterium]
MRSLYFFAYILVTVATLHGATSKELVNGAKEAMSNSLWDVAAMALQEASTFANLTQDDEAEIILLLAESLVRGNQPQQALLLLEKSAIRDLSRAKFWTGNALAGMGRFAEAVEVLLESTKPDSNPFADEAVFTAASLQLSLAKPEAALDTLRILDNSKSSQVRIQSIIRQVEILCDLERSEEARYLLPNSEDVPESLTPEYDFLRGLLALAENNPEIAESVFEDLLQNPTGQSVIRYTQAAIGRADALAKSGNSEAATQSLLNFIQEKPDSPMLDAIFRRIVEWFPEEFITMDHPTLNLLNDWIPRASATQSRLINGTSETALGAWPQRLPEANDLGVFATHARAIGLYRVKNPTAKLEARSLLNRIRYIAPDHFLASQALFQMARWELENDRTDEAFILFDTLRQTANSPILRGEAAFMDAVVASRRGDARLAKTLFEEAAENLQGEQQKTAYFNNAIARLQEDPSQVFLIQTDNLEEAAKLNRDLTLERALANPNPSEAKTALDKFLKANPEHTRAVEARLAIVDAAMASQPPDLGLARAQIDTLKNLGVTFSLEQSSSLALAELRLLDAMKQTEQAIETARGLIDRFPDSEEASDARLILGKTLYSAGNYNEARLILEKLATTESGTQRSQAAFLLAARSAALGATVQSREEALQLFDKTIAIEGPLKNLAILEKARLNIELNRLPTAVDSLKETYNTLPPDDLSRLPTGLLLAEAIYAQGGSNSTELEEALKIYDDLLEATKNRPAQFFRLQYLRGLALEKIPDPKDQKKTRLGEALAAYFSVLDRPIKPQPPEWEWFERSGFRALSLLENAERWQAAISIAEKIASFGGPRAEEAATRAKQLRLKHMIWEN